MPTWHLKAKCCSLWSSCELRGSPDVHLAPQQAQGCFICASEDKLCPNFGVKRSIYFQNQLGVGRTASTLSASFHRLWWYRPDLSGPQKCSYCTRMLLSAGPPQYSHSFITFSLILWETGRKQQISLNVQLFVKIICVIKY